MKRTSCLQAATCHSIVGLSTVRFVAGRQAVRDASDVVGSGCVAAVHALAGTLFNAIPAC